MSDLHPKVDAFATRVRSSTDESVIVDETGDVVVETSSVSPVLARLAHEYSVTLVPRVRGTADPHEGYVDGLSVRYWE